MLRSVQGRIVLGSVAIAALVVALLAVVILEQLRHVAGETVVTLAQEELRPYVADLRGQPDESPDTPAPGMLILVLSPQGAPVVDSLPPGLTTVVERSGTQVSRVHDGGVSYVAVGQAVTNARGTWRLWAVRSSTAATLTVQGFGDVLLLLIPIVLLLVAIGSWLLVRAAFRPVRRLRTAAEEIRSRGFGGRLPEGTNRDELHELAATLNRLLEAQQDALDRERRMVADASHELRTPLAMLTMQLEISRGQRGDADALERKVHSAQAQVRALSRLTTQLLELSQLETDPVSRVHAAATVGELVSETMAGVDRARAIAPDHVQVDLELSPQLREDRWSALGATEFRRIIDNLVSNALHATTTGAVELQLTQSDEQVVLTVLDTGTGIAPEFLPRAFERFARSEESRASGAPGSGIGLTLVQALVADVGGTVELTNRAPTGAAASVRIPLISDPEHH